jgi:hypothetical protein
MTEIGYALQSGGSGFGIIIFLVIVVAGIIIHEKDKEKRR